MTPLTIIGAYLWLIKPLIKAHVENNVGIYYGTIEIRAELKLTLRSKDWTHCGGNNPVLIVHQQLYLYKKKKHAQKNTNANSEITKGRSL